jgi:hypothetical protein
MRVLCALYLCLSYQSVNISIGAAGRNIGTATSLPQDPCAIRDIVHPTVVVTSVERSRQSSEDLSTKKAWQLLREVCVFRDAVIHPQPDTDVSYRALFKVLDIKALSLSLSYAKILDMCAQISDEKPEESQTQKGKVMDGKKDDRATFRNRHGLD